MLGEALQTMGNFPVAMDAYIKALKIYEDKNNSYSIAIAQMCIGGLYADHYKYREALMYDFMAMKKFEAVNQNSMLCSITANIGFCF